MTDGRRLETHSHLHSCLSFPITTLEEGAYTLPVLMLYAAFQILIEFARSNSLTETDWTQSIEMERARDEIVRLHNWWMCVRPARKSPLESEILVPDFSGVSDMREYAAYFKALEEDARLHISWELEDQDNLAKLIGVRNFL